MELPSTTWDQRPRRHIDQLGGNYHPVLNRSFQSAFVDNNEWVRRNVILGRRGYWHEYGYGSNRIRYYHHPSTYGLVYVCFGDYWFWTYYYNDQFWWYHPQHHWWLCYRDRYWWRWDPAVRVWILWDDEDRYWSLRDGDLYRTPVPEAPSALPAQDEAQKIFYSPDGTLMVYVLGERKTAHLYTYPGMEYINPLGEYVDKVQFGRSADGETQILAVYTSGEFRVFDREGNQILSNLPSAPPDEGIQEKIKDTPISNPGIGEPPSTPVPVQPPPVVEAPPQEAPAPQPDPRPTQPPPPPPPPQTAPQTPTSPDRVQEGSRRPIVRTGFYAALGTNSGEKGLPQGYGGGYWLRVINRATGIFAQVEPGYLQLGGTKKSEIMRETIATDKYEDGTELEIQDRLIETIRGSRLLPLAQLGWESPPIPISRSSLRDISLYVAGGIGRAWDDPRLHYTIEEWNIQTYGTSKSVVDKFTPQPDSLKHSGFLPSVTIGAHLAWKHFENWTFGTTVEYNRYLPTDGYQRFKGNTWRFGLAFSK